MHARCTYHKNFFRGLSTHWEQSKKLFLRACIVHSIENCDLDSVRFKNKISSTKKGENLLVAIVWGRGGQTKSWSPKGVD